MSVATRSRRFETNCAAIWRTWNGLVTSDCVVHVSIRTAVPESNVQCAISLDSSYLRWIETAAAVASVWDQQRAEWFIL